MATNIYLSDFPDNIWNSVYSDIIYKFDFKDYQIFSATEQIASSVGTGKTQINLFYTFDVIPVKNQYVYISTGEYTGIHRVLSGTSNSVVIDYEFNANITGEVFIKHLRLPQFSLYKGFVSGEQFPDALPYTLVTNFTYTFNSLLQLEINVKGLAQKIFKIVQPDLYQDYDFSVFNAIRLGWDDQVSDLVLVLNSSIPTDQLNALHINSGLPLTNVDEQLLWGCGNTFYTIMEDGYPKIKIFNGYEQAVTGFNNAFQTNQFSQGFDIN